MAVSESGQIIGRLNAAGVNNESIGQALDRHRSLVRQVARGDKPGHNLRDALAALEQRLTALGDASADTRNAAARAASVPRPRARLTKSNTVARVRAKTTHGGTGWSVSNVKQQAARNGARGLLAVVERAAEDGQGVAVTIGFNKRVSVREYGKGKRGRSGPGGAADFQLGDAESVRAEVETMYGGNLTAYVCAQAIERGLVSGVADEREAAANVLALELRSY